MEDLRIGCVVMAAGNASRFGCNKLSSKVGGKSLVERILDAIPPDIFYKVVVVTQYPEIRDLAKRHGFETVINEHPDYGISHTIGLGTTQLVDSDAIMYTVSDQPLLNRESIKAVVDLWRKNPDKIAAAGSGGVRGNPCIFPKEFFPELLELEEDHGGNTVIRRHEDRLIIEEVPPYELTDVDTKEALDAIKDESDFI